MSGNSTSFYINLAGNISQQSQRFGRDVTQMSSRSQTAMGRISSTVAAATAKFSKLGGAVSNVSKKFNEIGNWSTPILGMGITAGTAMVSKSMVRVAADFEMAGIRMKQTFGDRGDEAMAWLKKFATDTPMAFGDVQSAAMQMMTAGIDPMNGSLQALVDYNAKIGGTKEQLNDFINSFQKMSATGKMTWEDVLPLLQRNVPVLKMLSEATGGKYSDKQILQMIKEGKMQGKAIDALWKQMGKNAKGAAKEQMKTWDGLMSNLGDTWTSMQARFMEHGAFDSLKAELGDLLKWLNEQMDNGNLDEFAKTVSDVLVNALKDLKDIAKDVKPVLESIGSVMGWLSEQAGGYGNLAKFAGALYLGNKVANWGTTQAVAKGAWGLGKGAVNRFRRGNTPTTAGVAGDVASGLLGGATGVQSVYVVNMPLDGLGVGGLEDKRGRRNRSARRNKIPRPGNAATTSGRNAPRIAPQVSTQGTQQLAQTANQLSHATRTTTQVANSTRAMMQPMASAAKGLSKALPVVGTALTAVNVGSVMMDKDASVMDKSEAIGSAAGATVGAIVGQALIPIPGVGAAIGGVVGNYLGEWLGSKVGERLADVEPPENKVTGKIEVNVRASDQLIAATSAPQVTTTGGQKDAFELAAKTGYIGAKYGVAG